MTLNHTQNHSVGAGGSQSRNHSGNQMSHKVQKPDPTQTVVHKKRANVRNSEPKKNRSPPTRAANQRTGRNGAGMQREKALYSPVSYQKPASVAKVDLTRKTSEATTPTVDSKARKSAMSRKKSEKQTF